VDTVADSSGQIIPAKNKLYEALGSPIKYTGFLHILPKCVFLFASEVCLILGGALLTFFYLFFYFLFVNVKIPGANKSEIAGRHTALVVSLCLCAHLAHISGDTTPLRLAHGLGFVS
jgi:hypothetical protein